MKKNNYRFLEIDEKGEECHLHQFYKDGEWKNMYGTTTILEILGKVLTWWAAGKSCETLGWTNEWQKDASGRRMKIPQEQRLTHLDPYYRDMRKLDELGFLKLLDKAYRAHNEDKKGKAVIGTDRHAELSKYILSVMAGKPIKVNKDTKDFALWAKKYVKRFLGSEVHCYDEKIWTGGIIDFIAELKDGEFVIGDFKSAKEVYFNNIVQCGGYAMQLETNGAFDKNGKRLFKLAKPVENFIIFPFGSPKFSFYGTNRTEQLKKVFGWCVDIFNEKNIFDKRLFLQHII